jgi:hypothetical protein
MLHILLDILKGHLMDKIPVQQGLAENHWFAGYELASTKLCLDFASSCGADRSVTGTRIPSIGSQRGETPSETIPYATLLCVKRGGSRT